MTSLFNNLIYRVFTFLETIKAHGQTHYTGALQTVFQLFHNDVIEDLASRRNSCISHVPVAVIALPLIRKLTPSVSGRILLFLTDGFPDDNLEEVHSTVFEGQTLLSENGQIAQLHFFVYGKKS